MLLVESADFVFEFRKTTARERQPDLGLRAGPDIALRHKDIVDATTTRQEGDEPAFLEICQSILVGGFMSTYFVILCTLNFSVSSSVRSDFWGHVELCKNELQFLKLLLGTYLLPSFEVHDPSEGII